MGLWYGEKHGGLGWNRNIEGSYRGLFLPFGYECRQRWGSNGQKVAGIRLIAAYSPVGRREDWIEVTFEGSWFWGEGYRVETPVSKTLERWMFGFTFFVGI